jgi:hypothetical protein
MKILKQSFVFLFALSSLSSMAQGSDTLAFWKGGVVYQGKRYLKPAQIAPILLKKEDTQISHLFSKYKNNKGAGSVFGFLGGFGVGYSLSSSLIGGGKFPTGLFAAGIGAMGIGLIFNGSANTSLKQAIHLYNGKQAGKAISLRPFIYQDYSITYIGMSVKL